MSNLPIRRLTVSDFRRIEGTRELPFDAPIVLIHGSNGTGKTSILSALELALTGSIQSLERQSARYRAHLPFFGQLYATVRADVADSLQSGNPGTPLTVNGARLEGTPALSKTAAAFYSERCYLDQASLGRLLDLYQARESNEQTAIEKFVNELLGLDALDALRDGLSPANDLRLLKKLAVGIDEADQQAKAAATALKEQSALLTEIKSHVTTARAATRAAVAKLRSAEPDDMSDEDLIGFARSVFDEDSAKSAHATATRVHQELIALSGRIAALVERPTTQQVQNIRAALTSALKSEENWAVTDGVKIRAWEAAAEDAGANTSSGPREAVEQAIDSVRKTMDNAAQIGVQAGSLATQLSANRKELGLFQARLAEAREHSSALLEGLASLRTVIDSSNSCPVCDRDFTETGDVSLASHIDTKLSDLTAHGQELVSLRNARDEMAARVAQTETEHVRLISQVLTGDEQQQLKNRYAKLTELQSQLDSIERIEENGADLTRQVRSLQQSIETFEATALEEDYVRSQLVRYAGLMKLDLPSSSDSFQEASAELLQRADAEVSHLAESANRHREAATNADVLEAVLKREHSTSQAVADLAEQKKYWDDRFTEAKRRQVVAKEVHEAATKARTEIVHRVFTDSLNDVWKAVFTRLAPNEGFIPRFGIPHATKKSFDIKLETTHRSGESSGPPQMMLSAGNLNTAALSLFIALHLAVEPVVPCLVFDDPVQAMDEVHVAQFAALIRLLAKQNKRQVVIAVHERELFDYLALELSPAYAGDELITIELGDRAVEEDHGVTRHVWTPDPAIAI